MRSDRLALAVVLALSLPFQVRAQARPDSGGHRMPPGGRFGGRGMELMAPMPGEDSRIDSLLQRLHQASAARKTAALEELVGAMVEERKLMHAHMQGMMHMMAMMHGGMREPGAMGPAGKGCVMMGGDSSPDSAASPPDPRPHSP